MLRIFYDGALKEIYSKVWISIFKRATIQKINKRILYEHREYEKDFECNIIK